MTSFPSATPVLAILIAAGWTIILSLALLLLAQQIWIVVSARRSAHREELFKIITENAADMIALVNGQRAPLLQKSFLPEGSRTDRCGTRAHASLRTDSSR